MTEIAKYEQIFEYVRDVPAPPESAGLLVFGRKDLLVADTVGNVMDRGLADFVVISGGYGKDSGDLKVPESHFLLEGLRENHPNLQIPVFTEVLAINGAGNALNSMKLMDKKGLPYQKTLTGISHATSARRLVETIRHQAIQRKTPIERLYGVATNYNFDPTNPKDQNEAAAELLRLADWPAKNLLQPQLDLPENLVDFARENHAAPMTPSPIYEMTLKAMPLFARRHAFRIMNYLNNRKVQSSK